MSDLTIRDAVSDYLNKTCFLPSIQREFVWEPWRIEKLFDSIMDDYPIGSFLFWKVREEDIPMIVEHLDAYEFIKKYDDEKPHNSLADLKNFRKDIYLVLDGQQRLTAFNIALNGTYRYHYYRWLDTRLYLNLLKIPKKNHENPDELKHQFCFREDSATDDPKAEFWYEVSRILGFEDPEHAKNDLDRDATFSTLTPDSKQVAKEMLGRLHTKTFINKPIAFQEVKKKELDDIVEIFVRVNTAGKTLGYSNILLSTATANWHSINARDEILGFVDEINTIGTGFDFSQDFVLKGCLFLTEDLPIQYKVANFTKSNLEKIESNWDEIKFCISETVKLIHQFGFSRNNLVAPLAILPIAYYIKHAGIKKFVESTKKEVVENQNIIQKWLVQVLLKNAFGSSTDNKLKDTREILKKANSGHYPYSELNGKMGIDDGFSSTEVDQMLGYNYRTRYSFLVLSLIYPDRDWKDISYNEDHIFPKSEFSVAKLRKRKYSEEKISDYQKHFNSLLNLELLTESENKSKNASDFNDWIKTRDANFKTRHMIPNSGLEFNEFLDFVMARKVLLTKRLNEAFKSKI